MKILYIGSACNEKSYENLLNKCRKKPTVAPFVFESALIKGMYRRDDVDLSILSRPIVPALPNSKIFFVNHKKEEILDGLFCEWIPTVNIHGIKEFVLKLNGRTRIKKWLKKNVLEKDKVVITYSVDSLTVPIQKLCKKYGTKCICIVADLPRDGYFAGRKLNPFKKILARIYTRNMERIQNGFDGYVYLTEAMKDVLGQGKPYCVVEGIADVQAFDFVENGLIHKHSPRAILYAGTLAERYGIPLIIDSFNKCKGYYELWICGSGDYEDEIKKISEKKQNIKFFGRLPHDAVLRMETEATLMLNIRNNNDDYTAYSFPSKTMEYMLSGTPFATTALAGIPNEYYDYLYVIKGTNSDEISKEIDRFMNDENMSHLGKRAKAFVTEKKNCYTQGNRVVDFARKIIDEDEI